MGRTRILVTTVLVASTYATAQGSLPELSIRFPAVSLFLKTHPTFTFLAEVPARLTSIEIVPATNIKGQIPWFGGPLQYYINVSPAYALHDVLLPFGANFMRPVYHGRVEVFGAMGGIFVPTATRSTRPNACLTQTSLGARVSLDQSRRFWVGATAWYLTDFADKKRQVTVPPI
jgi:hypothetical protein